MYQSKTALKFCAFPDNLRIFGLRLETRNFLGEFRSILEPVPSALFSFVIHVVLISHPRGQVSDVFFGSS